MNGNQPEKKTRMQIFIEKQVKIYGTQKALADFLGYTPSFINQLLKGSATGERSAFDIAKKFGINPQELTDDEDLVPTEELQRDEHIPVYVVSEFKAWYAKSGTTIETLGPGTATVPKGSEMTIPADVGERRVGIRLETSIYEPTFKAGDILIIDPSILPSIGNICLVLLGEELIFRRLEHLSEIETHFSWPNAEGRLEVFKISTPMQPVIWGKVTGLRREL